MKKLKKKLNELQIEPFDDKFQKANTKEIIDFERGYGFKLPDDYQWFLRNYGASNFEVEVACKSEEPSSWSNDGNDSIDFFYGLNPTESSLDCLKGALDTYSDRFPEGVLPIGEADSGGNLICMSVNKENYGYILFWDHESDTEEKQFYKMASSFSKFVELLFEDPVEIGDDFPKAKVELSEDLENSIEAWKKKQEEKKKKKGIRKWFGK